MKKMEKLMVVTSKGGYLMPLVLCILGACILFSFLAFLFLLSTIRIQLQNLEIGNGNNKFQYQYVIIIEIYFLDKINFFRKTITSTQIKKSKWIKKIENIPWEQFEKKEDLSFKQWVTLFKNLKIELTKFVLKIDIGTEDAVFTSYLVAAIASFIGISLPHVMKKKYLSQCYYRINPLYIDQNRYHIALDSIIRVKVVHIIYIIYILIQKGSKKNERTSNRRSYDHRHELYTRNG